ncbi:MAG: phospholipase D-like domain-containing protein [Rhabdochlamydiaceae bacterium]
MNAKKRGVDVQVIVDKYSVKVRSSLAKMVDAGIFVSVWDPGKGKKDKQALMHNKFCVFGSEAVWTGSFNFTYRASRLHQENVVVLRNKEIAAEFKKQFNNIKLRGCLPFSSYIMYHTHKPTKKHVKR